MSHLELPSFISEGMIIQREKPVPIWGWTAPQTQVSLSFLNKTYCAVSDTNGRWRIFLEPGAAGGPYIMNITAGDTGITLADIFVGDLWLCSGQSNMELSFIRLKDDFPEEFTVSEFPCIRELRFPHAWDFTGPREKTPQARWVQASAQSLLNFSGTGWFFAKKLHQRYRIPIGLIVAAAGGAPIESWMSKDALKNFPDLLAKAEKYKNRAYTEQAIKNNWNMQQVWQKKIQALDKGLEKGKEWFRPDAVYSDWQELSMPGNFADNSSGELQHFCGVIWLKKEVEIPDELTAIPAKIWLGTIVDADTVYINGIELGTITYRYPPRKYEIPSGLLRKGRNHITIRIVCNNGEGGITKDKPFYIFSSQSPCKVALQGAWKYKIAARIEPKPEEFFIHWEPIGLYNGIIAPVLQAGFKGVIWYQGESNTERPGNYAELFKAMIQDWRDKSGQEELPFLFVQLPIFGHPTPNSETSTWAAVRAAQAAALSLPKTGIAIALDLGEWNDLHPVNKKDVGYRLALAAESLVYGAANTSPGPMVQNSSRQGDTWTITFANCGAGLAAKDAVYVSVVSEDGHSYRLPAAIHNVCQLVIDVSSIRNPQRVLYAWADNPIDRNLYNADGFPALPFNIQSEVISY